MTRDYLAKFIECQYRADWISSKSIKHFSIVLHKECSIVDDRSSEKPFKDKFMVILSLSENLDDTILQEEEACSVISWTLQNITFLEHFDLQIVNDIMQSIVSNIFKVLNPLNTPFGKSFHPVIVCINALFQLLFHLWELYQDFLILSLFQDS